MDAKKRNPGLSSGIQAWVFEKVSLKLTYTRFIEKNLLDFEITRTITHWIELHSTYFSHYKLII